METFNWKPQNNSNASAAPKVNVTKFGDEYETRRKEGIHNDLRSYSVSFVGLTEKIDLIEDFLTRHNGVKAFLWREPNRNRLITVKCQSWNPTPNGAAKTITATFEEVVA